MGKKLAQTLTFLPQVNIYLLYFFSFLLPGGEPITMTKQNKVKQQQQKTKQTTKTNQKKPQTNHQNPAKESKQANLED